MSDEGDDVISVDRHKTVASFIVIGSGILVSILCFGLFYFYGRQSSLAVKGVLTAPKNLSQVRVAYRLPGDGRQIQCILNKIEVVFFHERGKIFTSRLLPEDYEDIFSLIQSDKPLSKGLSDAIVWDDTVVSVRIIVSSIDSDTQSFSVFVYQEIEFGPDGSLFRISIPKRSFGSDRNDTDWVYYHHPGVLRMIRKKFHTWAPK
ncbi:hypothetical protein [Candidatus Similichlamydia epinepheli]|uniref:hypothetical protein n=1 Tax=Candidatus Similichlamydia epinepheli TaxID=1903953 RepID=UPI000D34970F|nr:hypothetical protein [Candidatus Similichlamydia epinepheli]